MSSQAAVRSIDELKNLRVALALYGEDTLATLGAVEAEVRRTLRWIEEERPVYWHDQIKRRREQVALARGDVFRRNLQKRPGHSPAMSEQKEALRKAEASLQDAEKRLVMVRKWQPLLKQAVLEYHANVQRLKDLAAGDVPSAVNLMTRIVDALEAYLQLAPPSGSGTAGLDSSSSGTMSAGARRHRLCQSSLRFSTRMPLPRPRRPRRKRHPRRPLTNRRPMSSTTTRSGKTTRHSTRPTTISAAVRPT